MHFCAIIVKQKSVSNEEARAVFGEALVKLEHADYYKEDDVRLFNGDRSSVSLKEFKVIYKSWLDSVSTVNATSKYFSNDLWMFAIVDDGYISTAFYPTGFYEFYDLPEYRESLINTYLSAYKLSTIAAINELNEDDYEVTLMDYHN